MAGINRRRRRARHQARRVGGRFGGGGGVGQEQDDVSIGADTDTSGHVVANDESDRHDSDGGTVIVRAPSAAAQLSAAVAQHQQHLSNTPPPPPFRPPPPDHTDEEDIEEEFRAGERDIYHVPQILAARPRPTGREFLVHWEGFPLVEDLTGNPSSTFRRALWTRSCYKKPSLEGRCMGTLLHVGADEAVVVVAGCRCGANSTKIY